MNNIICLQNLVDFLTDSHIANISLKNMSNKSIGDVQFCIFTWTKDSRRNRMRIFRTSAIIEIDLNLKSMRANLYGCDNLKW